MQIYDASRLYTLDLDDSHLSQEEIAEYVALKRRQEAIEKERERVWRASLHSTGYKGGMQF